tara:strand:- start:1120 stop:2079 length:960 start_codon:yes stop_codon:yes gene_type:complete
MVKNFAVVGCGGYVAPRHLEAIEHTGNQVVAAMDKNDSVGILDSFGEEIKFFTEFERFMRYGRKLKLDKSDKKIDYFSICSPNFLHDTHIHAALDIGADAICEKPLVISPWNLDSLSEHETRTGKKIYNVLQLRVHPSIINLKRDVEKKDFGSHEIDLTYITPRGPWYDQSWKGNDEMSGGLATNIGIHFFDMLGWIFGNNLESETHYKDHKKIGGYCEFDKARVRWFLSRDSKDLPSKLKMNGKNSPYRSILIDGEELEFSNVFKNLHNKVYEDILSGRGSQIEDVRPAIELAYDLKQNNLSYKDVERIHPFTKRYIK